MTPQQKIKHAIIKLVSEWEKNPGLFASVTPENVDEIYELLDEARAPDARNEFRCSGIETGLPCEWSRHYEAEAVAAEMPDGSWVGWTYWHGGGKHGEPEAIDWIESAYDVNCAEEEKTVVVRTFSKVEEQQEQSE